jgi:ubiquinone/menaquinone biosynthesis C-methylase UbiE
MLTTQISGSLVGGGESPRRLLEQNKYKSAYQDPSYRMGTVRMEAARQDLAQMRGSLLDVGCGRGEVLQMALESGLKPVMGVEVVPALCDGKVVVPGEVTDLPFKRGEFDNVTFYDVLEHLPPEDSEQACKELQRVARQFVVLTVADYSHIHKGVELHVNRRPYAEWDRLFRGWFDGQVEWVKGRKNISETWRVQFY